MIKSVLAIVAFFCVSLIFGQDEEQRISLTLDNALPKEVISKLEQKTGYHFFYAQEDLDSVSISKVYTNTRIDSVLANIFDKTSLNFFITSDKRVILTKNNLIYDKLPERFFEHPDFVEENDSEDSENVGDNVYLSDRASDPIEVRETVRIGKEHKNYGQKAYKLSGFITNALSGNPIPNLAVLVRKKNLGVMTNDRGYYEIDLPSGINDLETSSLGYVDSKRKVIMYNNGQLNFSLDESYELLDEVIVNADLTRNIEDTSTGNTKIGTEESKNIPLVLGERDLLKVATTLPGVTTAGEGSSGFNVRGGKTDQNLILLDNAVIYNSSHFFGIFQALNPFAIRDVNIYKGAIPVEYGGRLSSVFEISSKDPNTEKMTGEASIGPVTANAVVEVPIVKGKSGLLLGARVAYSDWVLRSLKDVSLRKSSVNFYDVMGKYNHQINENNRVTATGYYSNDSFSITSDSLYGYSNRLFSVKWDHKFNAKNTASLILANSNYQFDIDYDGSDSDNFLQQYQIQESEVKLRLKYLMNEKHNFDYGISGKLYGVFPGKLGPKVPQDIILPVSIPKEQGLEGAFFISDNFKVNDKLLLDFGFRYSFFAALGKAQQYVYDETLPKSGSTVLDTLNFNKNEVIKTYGGPEARISARYLLGKDFSVKGSFNNSYQYIHTLSNNTTVSPIDTWKLSDYNIKPQQANQFSLGLYKNINGNEYEFSLEGFYKNQKNLLDFKTGAKLSLNQNVETEVLQGKGRAYGVEFFVKKNRGKLNGWLGYTYSRSLLKLDSNFREERVNDGRFFASNFDKPHDFSLVLNYKITRRYSFSSNFVYQTGRPVTFPVGNYSFNGLEYVLYSDRNRYRISDYYRLDIGFNIEGNHKANKTVHSFWNISVYNILGRNNPYSVFFVADDGEIKALQSSIFAIPIPSITYNFRF